MTGQEDLIGGPNPIPPIAKRIKLRRGTDRIRKWPNESSRYSRPEEDFHIFKTREGSEPPKSDLLRGDCLQNEVSDSACGYVSMQLVAWGEISFVVPSVNEQPLSALENAHRHPKVIRREQKMLSKSMTNATRKERTSSSPRVIKNDGSLKSKQGDGTSI